MKKIIISFTLLFVSFCMKGQIQRFTYTTTIGIGIAMNEPSYTSLSWHVLGYYNIGKWFSAGIGTGLSFYEVPLIPLFVNAKLAITRPNKFTPYVEFGSGYAFAPSKNASGGFYLNPSVGVQYALSDKLKLHLAVGYELQKLERLKNFENQYFTSGFAENLNHNSLSVKVGIVF